MKAVITWPEHLKGQQAEIVNSPAVDVYNVTLESGESAVFHGDNLTFGTPCTHDRELGELAPGLVESGAPAQCAKCGAEVIRW